MERLYGDSGRRCPAAVLDFDVGKISCSGDRRLMSFAAVGGAAVPDRPAIPIPGLIAIFSAPAVLDVNVNERRRTFSCHGARLRVLLIESLFLKGPANDLGIGAAGLSFARPVKSVGNHQRCGVGRDVVGSVRGGQAANGAENEIGDEAGGEAARVELRRIAADGAVDTEMRGAENLLRLVSLGIERSVRVNAQIHLPAPAPSLRDFAIVAAHKEPNPRKGEEPGAAPDATIRIVED